jgi:hypothetical protein
MAGGARDGRDQGCASHRLNRCDQLLDRLGSRQAKGVQASIGSSPPPPTSDSHTRTSAGPGTAGVGHGRGAGHGIAPRLRGLVPMTGVESRALDRPGPPSPGPPWRRRGSQPG